MRPVPEVEPIVKEVVAINAGVPPTEVHWETNFVEIGLTGASKAHAFAELEVVFNVVLMPYIDQFTTVGQTTEYISVHAPPAT